ncbi:STAS domain-containing protein [Streptomyces sp. ALI-76-A]|uniref:STAS domain-containing protein n=1 Tax=Streptomyces sp. ALI-76-A TaxID=3025736 RepID=UPI00256EE40A|nr:STAS domain-containing protein [Streptomyces sp. ALI-76-A]MDL5199301.1 hypothetical protein [Streptomyces sp. ALI-76-A]
MIQINEVIDFEAEGAAQRHLRREISRSATRTVIIDVRTPLVTAAAVVVLLRTRRFAHSRGAVLCVVAREPLARTVLRVTGVSRYLRVTATLSGALALARGCRPVPRPPTLPCHGALERGHSS